jgi:hypothetical protein
MQCCGPSILILQPITRHLRRSVLVPLRVLRYLPTLCVVRLVRSVNPEKLNTWWESVMPLSESFWTSTGGVIGSRTYLPGICPALFFWKREHRPTLQRTRPGMRKAGSFEGHSRFSGSDAMLLLLLLLLKQTQVTVASFLS